MKALVCHEYGHYRDLKFCDVDKPELKPGCVRLAVHYATAGFGQTLVIAGKYQRKPPLPFVPGTEVAGVVMEVAPDVTGFVAGDRVTSALDWGGYAEQATATASTTWHVPDAVPLRTAASVPLTYGTAYAALHWRARLRAGESLLVYGAAGGIGLPAVELGRLAGAHVIAIASSAERVQIVREHGAHHGLIRGSSAELSRDVMAANGGRKVDVIFDPVGGQLFDEGLRCLQPEGRILVLGFASGEVPKIPANILLVKNAEVLGFWFGLYLGWGLTDERERYQVRLREMMNLLFAHVEAGDLKPVSSVVFPLERLADAFDAVVEGRAVGRAMVKTALAED